MAKIADGTLRNWNDGETVYEKDYEQDREILRAAINDTDTRVDNTYTKVEVDDKINTAASTAYVQTGTTFPSSPVDGQQFFKNDTDLYYIYDAGNAAWIVINDILEDNSVTTVKIVDGAVTAAKTAADVAKTAKVNDLEILMWMGV